MLNSSCTFHFSSFYFSGPEFLFSSFLPFIFLLIFSFWSYIVFLIFFSFFVHDILLLIVDLILLTSNYNVWASSRMVSIKFFFSCWWALLYSFFVCFVNFCWELDILNIILWYIWKSNFPTPQGLLIFTSLLEPSLLFYLWHFQTSLAKCVPFCAWSLKFLFHYLWSANELTKISLTSDCKNGKKKDYISKSTIGPPNRHWN